MPCPPLLHRADALVRALDALDAAGRHDLAVALRVTPTAREAASVCGQLASMRLPSPVPAIRAVSAFALVADEPPDPPPPSLVVAVE